MIVIYLTLLAFVIALVALVFSIIILKKMRHKTILKRNLVVVGVVITSLFMIVVVGFAIFLIFFGQLWGDAWRGNQAERDVRPILTKIEQLGAKEICHKGNNGYEITTTTPSYSTYYSVASPSPDLTSKIKAITRGHGFELQENSKYINYLQGTPTIENNVILDDDNKEKFSATTDYLIASYNDANIDVIIHRDTTVTINCPESGIFERKEPTGTGAIIEIGLSLPAVKR